MDTFLPSYSNFMVYFVTTEEMHGFPHQNPLCEFPGCFSTVLLSVLVPKSIDSLKGKTKKPDKVLLLKKKNQFQARWNSKQNISKEIE